MIKAARTLCNLGERGEEQNQREKRRNKETHSKKGEWRISTKEERKAGIKTGFHPQKVSSSQALQVMASPNPLYGERYSCRTRECCRG